MKGIYCLYYVLLILVILYNAYRGAIAVNKDGFDTLHTVKRVARKGIKAKRGKLKRLKNGLKKIGGHNGKQDGFVANMCARGARTLETLIFS
jgi:hypothetical protein